MVQEDFCSRCPQSHDCKAVYERLGGSQGPNVATKVVVAFLLPIAVFIAALALFDHVLAKVIAGKNTRIAAGFALAACASFVFILIVRMVNVRLAKNQAPDGIEGDKTSKLKQD
jgi:hypothetical protein